MYIISKKKDYYDGVAGTTGIDKTIVYDRQIIEVDQKDYPEFFKRHPYNAKKINPLFKLGNTRIKKELQTVDIHSLYGFTRYEDLSYFIIGFCGKLYVGWKLYSEGKERPYGGKELITTITYDNEIKKMVEQFIWDGNFDDSLNYILTYDSIDVFRFLRTPVFLYDNDYGRRIDIKEWRNHPKFFINPLLKEYQFFKVFDAV